MIVQNTLEYDTIKKKTVFICAALPTFVKIYQIFVTKKVKKIYNNNKINMMCGSKSHILVVDCSNIQRKNIQ